MSEVKTMSSIQFPNTQQPYQVEDHRIPQNPGEYKQMATDENGQIIWMPLLAYSKSDFVAAISQTINFETAGGNNAYTASIPVPNGVNPAIAWIDNCIVVWDEIPYYIGKTSSMGYFGNLFLQNESEEDNGLPFCIKNPGYYIESDTWSNINVFAKDAGEHTFEIGKNSVVYVPIDPNYLPQSVAYNTSTIFGDDTLIGSNHYNVIAIGRDNSVTNYAAIVIGNDNSELTTASIVIGENNVSPASHRAVIGYNNTAGGYAFGEYLKGSAYITLGRGNAAPVGGTLLRIGNAHTYSAVADESRRSNAHTLDWNGNAWYAGTVEGTGMIVKSSTAESTKRFLVTVDDSGTISATEVTETTT